MPEVARIVEKWFDVRGKKRRALLIFLMSILYVAASPASTTVLDENVKNSCAAHHNKQDGTNIDTDQEFIKSFIGHYDFCKQGRYTHEYHSFLLQKAAVSMDELENYLERQALTLHGRMVIAGYEEQAIPSYYTDYSRPVIIDEAIQVSNAGIAAPPHNRFGLMTGFLFKDFNYFAKESFDSAFSNSPQTALLSLHKQHHEPIFEHINPELVEIYEGRATLFQQDAFGDLYDVLIKKQHEVERLFLEHKTTEILEELVTLWQTMYAKESKTGEKQVVGTQDILFSIEYVRHLMRSKIPLLKYSTGGDITYPIEVSLIHKKEATRNAQCFVQKFVPRLAAFNNEPTGYIFCSFVDGVGKSTMLGNVKNWTTYGTAIEKYSHVDNSSSQLAAVYHLKENVFVFDLPAQISHFTYKPDGSVYVDVKALAQESDSYQQLMAYVANNKVKLCHEYYKAIMALQDGVKLEKNDPTVLFLKNVCLFKKQTVNVWIPFCKDGTYYLFNFFDVSQLRALVPLKDAPSHGLKVVEPEQMIFDQGVRFPLSYQLFLEDLAQKIKDAGVKHIVFVDFISMYPRSCRENIRVNYLLQQMALLEEKFTFDQSIYADVLNDTHLFYSIKNKGIKAFASFLENEANIRLALYKIVAHQDRKHVDGMPMDRLAQELSFLIKSCDQKVKDDIATLALEKMRSEEQTLEHMYGLTKEFVNIQQFSFEALEHFSRFLENCFSKVVKNEDLNALWSKMGRFVTSKEDVCNGSLYKSVELDNGVKAQGLFLFWPECKKIPALESFFRMVRANWYAQLSNLLHVTGVDKKKVILQDMPYKAAPLVIKKSDEGKFYLVQPYLPLLDGPLSSEQQVAIAAIKKFNIDPFATVWGIYNKQLYCMNWENKGTSEGVFGFDCFINSFISPLFSSSSVVTEIVKSYKQKKGEDKVIPASLLYNELCCNEEWKKEYQEMLVAAQNSKDKQLQKQEVSPSTDISSLFAKPQRRPAVLATPQQQCGAQLMIRALATLEMIVKDASCDIVVRKGNKEDFSAALKLFEQVVVPKYFGIIFAKPLWKDYDAVTPCVPWNVLT